MARIYVVVKANPNDIRWDAGEKPRPVYYIASYFYPHLPVFGSFTTKRSEARKMAMQYTCCRNSEEYAYALRWAAREKRENEAKRKAAIKAAEEANKRKWNAGSMENSEEES